MSSENWGGSAAAGGLTFQAAISAVCMVHMACGRPLHWSTCANDTPINIASETGGAGDDVALQLVGGESLEIQAKRRLTSGPELWNALMALCRRAIEDSSFYGVLAIGPSSSASIREQLARDLVRLGANRRDDLSSNGANLANKLDDAGISITACARVRIQTVHVLDQDGASSQAAIAHLGYITAQPNAAWKELTAEGMRMIQMRGRQDTVSIANVIPGLRDTATGGVAPVVLAKQLIRWTLSTTGAFEIPGFAKTFSLDDDWIQLKARARDNSEGSFSSLQDALSRYHDGPSAGKRRHEAHDYSAETLGYFVRHCVVVAGPGMGKTLLLRRISRLLAHKNEPALIVRLRPLAERIRAGDTCLDAALHVGLDGSSLRPQDVLTIGLENLTLLLDGLDEAGGEQEQIANTVAAFAVSFPRCRIVVVTRPIGYDTALLNSWAHYELLPIESSDAKRSVERLVNAGESSATANIKQATAAATSHFDYKSEHQFSARSPLLVALLASLALNGIVAAETREGLYGQLFTLIERMAARKQNDGKVTPAVLNAFLQQLGWELTEHPYADLKTVLTACAERLGPQLAEPPLKARSICDEALRFWEAGGIIERVRFKTTEALTFVHKTFGEFAAAQYVLAQPADEQLELLRRIEPLRQWYEVVVFLSALGLGLELVRLALEDTAPEPHRELKWARYSKDALDETTAQVVLKRSWYAVAGLHSGQALQAGVALLAAVDKLPGADVTAQGHLDHDQWWTALVGWACTIRSNPGLLDFARLSNFMDSYVERADTIRLNRGFNLNNPSRQLWEDVLLPAAKEAVRRGIGPDEQLFIARVKQSLGARSMGFVSELSYILKEAGVEVELSGYGSEISRFFSPEYFEEGRREMLWLLEAICPQGYKAPEPVEPPFLHLSAFWYGSGLMDMEISAATLATDAEGATGARALIALTAHLSTYNYRQLIAEAQTKITTLKAASGLMRSFEGLEAVDAPVHFHGDPPDEMVNVLTAGLLHRSRWIVYLAANLAEHYLTTAQAAELTPKVFAKAQDFGLAGAAHLALHFLGKDVARELIVQRLKEPLNQGCMHLFDYLIQVWDPSLELRADELLRRSLFHEPHTAEAALELVQACTAERRQALEPLLKQAYDHWLQHEDPYPTGGGVIPPSPRGKILKLMIEGQSVATNVLFTAACDVRSDVASAARSALVKLMVSSSDARKELVQRIAAGEPLQALLRESLGEKVAFDSDEVQSIVTLLASSHAEDRHGAIDILDLRYLDADQIRVWCEKLRSDTTQYIRDSAYEKLSALDQTL